MDRTKAPAVHPVTSDEMTAALDAALEEGDLNSVMGRMVRETGLEDYFRFYNGLRPHQALGYRTPAEVFPGDQGVVEGDSKERKCSLEQGTKSLADEPGFTLNSALILSK